MGIVAFLVMLAGLALLLNTVVAGYTSKVMFKVGDEEIELMLFGEKSYDHQ